ncbi:uncharacterized protein TRUGW13939_04796 [Talaromyces rugulosus]|uniref:Carrier domain-containing protein n=1 Tax=Talaromyces rugulosus TaxID=121627 RepID=A0A7H8QVC1_TALRU|nr:uncharacterized protein TRUGW13939_04796 [Talaromyces rugulosus]QKX57678.1 hypothetical protein TRUGW13939_04796 [Talaromyces rugulosus]
MAAIELPEAENLSTSDRQQLAEWNGTVAETQRVCADELFERVCKEKPNATAVEAWDGNLTFHELDVKSSMLARLLVRRGVGPEIFVPICSDKSCWTTIAVYAVTKAGGAFALLDPSHPLSRLQEITNDLGAHLVLSSPARAELASQLADGLLVVILDDRLEKLAQVAEGQPVPSVKIQPHHPLYVVFTSGSTGKPKGAVLTHAAMTSALLAYKDALQLGPHARVLQFASYSFDVGVYDQYWSILPGGCLCVPSDDDRQNRLEETINKLQANWVQLTPSVARILNPRNVPSLRYIVLGGESLARRDLDAWSSHVHVVGIYGPAECSIAVTIQSSFAPSTPLATLGRAYGITCWVVDEHDHTQLMPVGATGELVLDGQIVSQRYLNNPEQNARAFIQNPPWLPANRISDRLMYKTGDLVRYQLDGTLYFIGRKDTQVKLRGQRIELTEVEHHVRQHVPGHPEIVAEVVVPPNRSPSLSIFILAPSHDNEEQLFGQADEAFRAQIRDLQSQVRRSVPRYMIPDLYLRLNRIPMTKTGKTDRRHLREQAAQLTVDQLSLYSGISTANKAMPIGAAEGTMQGLWADILGVARLNIGRNDSWVSLGGDSLLAMKLVGKVHHTPGLANFTVPDVFNHPTLADLAQLATMESAGQQLLPLVEPFAQLSSIERTTVLQAARDQCHLAPGRIIEDIYPCTVLQERIIRPSVQRLGNYTLRMQFDMPADLDVDRLAQAWKHVVACHPILRTRIIEAGVERWLQAVVREQIPLDRPTSLENYNVQYADIWGIGQRQARAALSPNKDILVVILHHVLYDLYTLTQLFQHMDHEYRAEIPSSPAVIPYSAFVKWTREIESSTRQFWNNMFDGFHGRVFPPLPSSLHQSLENSELHQHVPLVPDEFTASNKLALALAIATSWHINVPDVAFGFTMARRGAPVHDIAAMAAPAATILPIRVRLDEEISLGASLQRMKLQALEMMSYEGIEARDIAALNPGAAAAGQFQTLLLIQPDTSQDFPGLFKRWQMITDRMRAQWALMLACWLSADSVTLTAKFDREVIDDTQVQAFLGEIKAVMALMHDSPQILVKDTHARVLDEAKVPVQVAVKPVDLVEP